MIQFCFFIFWIVNLLEHVVSSFEVLFVMMMFIGGLRGAEFTNFLYLANSKILDKRTGKKADIDMGLTYYERELTINMLLMASDLGKLFAVILTISLK